MSITRHKVEATIMLACPILAIAAFLGLGLPQFLPQPPAPLTQVSPETATQIETEITRTTATLQSGRTTLKNSVACTEGDTTKTCQTAPAVKDGESVPAHAYAATFLPKSDLSVTTLEKVITRCEETIESARKVLDPEATLIGETREGDSGAIVIPLSGAKQMVDYLTLCQTNVVQAAKGVTTALNMAKVVASDKEAKALNQTARDGLAAAIDTAQGVYDGSAGQVTIEQVRTDLASWLATSRTALEAPVPVTGWSIIEAQTIALTATATSLTDQTGSVQESQAAWQEAEDAKNPSSSGKGPSTPGRTPNGTTPNNGTPNSGTPTSGTPDGGTPPAPPAPPAPAADARVVITAKEMNGDQCRFRGYITESTSKTLWVGISGFPALTDSIKTGLVKGEGWSAGWTGCPTTDVSLMWAELR